MTTPTKNITRFAFFSMLALAVPESALTAKNTITALPDMDAEVILAFYNAGVLTGVNDYGTFAGGKRLTRAEMAAMISRIARPETALAFTPKTPNPADPDFDPIVCYTGLSGDDVVLTAKDFSISAADYLAAFTVAADHLVRICQEQKVTFAWSNHIGENTFLSSARMEAVNSIIRSIWEAKHKDDVYDTSAILGAKHILVDTQAEADTLRAQLKAGGDKEATFDTLMSAHSKDGRNADGTLSAPEGYTFGPGEMVPEFEAGTKALKVGQVSDPIKSQFGYHIILRIQPDLLSAQEALASAAYNVWWDAQGLAYTDAMQTLDATAFYDGYAAGR